MEIENQQDVMQEVVTPSIEQEASGHLETQSNEAINQGTDDQGQDQSGDKDYNFRALREKMQVMESRYEEMAKERDEYKNVLLNYVKPKDPEPVPEVDDLADIEDDDWMTKEKAMKLAQREAQNIVKQALQEERQKRMQEELPTRLKSQFSDFEDVVTKENVDYLKANKPHIAATLAATKDPYSQAVAAYEYIKAFVPNAEMQEEKAKAEKNAQKPGNLSSAQISAPLSQAKMFESGKLSPELRQKLHQEMVAASRSY